MDFVISFFRDVLDGPLYITISIICGILICSCIGYLGERYLNQKKKAAEDKNKHVTISDKTDEQNNVTSDTSNGSVSNIEQNANSVQNTTDSQTSLESQSSVSNDSSVNAQSAVEASSSTEVKEVDETVVNEDDENEDEENKEDDPNANVNYNFTTISSDELLEDD